MSPITIVCLPVFSNAAHEVRPIGGVIFTPPAVTERSSRGTDTLKTPSFSLSEPFAPVRSSIAAVSRDGFAGGAANTGAAEKAAQAIAIERALIESSPHSPEPYRPGPQEPDESRARDHERLEARVQARDEQQRDGGDRERRQVDDRAAAEHERGAGDRARRRDRHAVDEY